MKRILIVAYYFPPTSVIGGMRPLGFCRYLSQYGWKPRVITTNCESVFPIVPQDKSLGERVPNDVIVHRIPHPNPGQAVIDIREFVRRKLGRNVKNQSLAHNEEIFHHDRKSIVDTLRQGLGSLKDYIWNWLFVFPDSQLYWGRAVERKPPTFKTEEYPHAVWATGRPWTGLLVGMKLAKQYGVPFIADFRDPWMDNTYSKPVPPGFINKARKLERSICVAASKVITTTPELSDWFKSQYPELKEKFVSITNGFDEDVLETIPPVDTEDQSRIEKARSEVTICHFGDVYAKRNPIHLLQALWELLEEECIHSRQVRVRFVGEWGEYSEGAEVVKELELKGVLSRTPRIPYDQCLQEMQRSDILLIIQPDAPLQIPGKIYEYISLGKPILLIGDSGATAALVKKHQLGRCCPNEVSSLKPLLLGLITRQDHISSPPIDEVGRFQYRFLAKQLAAILDSSC